MLRYPAEIRKTHGIKPQDDLEIFIDADKIILKKYITSCLFCGSTDNIVSYRGGRCFARGVQSG
jgi:transcriptional pleiotropic regulator of transition state genes